MESRARTTRAGGLILLLLLTLTLAGCLSSHSDVSYGPKGPPVGSDTLKQVECGRTSKGWLLAVLGEPSRAVQTPTGMEVLTYEYTRKIDSDLSFFIFFNADDRREERTVYVFEVEDDVVTRYWKEG